MPLNLPAILKLMATRGLTTTALAELALTNRPHISQILHGRRQSVELRTVERLAAALEVGVEAILRK